MGKIRKDLPFYTPDKHFCMKKHHDSGENEVLFDGDYDGNETSATICLVLAAFGVIIALAIIATLIFAF